MEGATENDQRGSRLFTLPAEIRASIFELALTSYDDPAKPYRADRKYYRPGYHHHQKIDCSLLLTCRRTYREARLLPISVNEHVFWLFNGPWKFIPGNNRNTARWTYWYVNLTEDQKSAVQTVHIFTQQCYLEDLLVTDAWRFSFRTSCLHLTLRHADWWSWESPVGSSDCLGICPWRPHRTSYQEMLFEPLEPSLAYIRDRMGERTWGGAVCKIRGLRKLVMEFEIDEKKKSQLQVVAERAKHWIFPLAGEEFVLEWTGQLEESSWEGVRDLRDDYHFMREQPLQANLPRRKYYVVKMTWRAKTAARGGLFRTTAMSGA
ncbi:hypothetical protein AYO22_09794 [Fonsecaea multimorphosa]|nr:hypothetical protein AYO22_09794 [Fonsecaea multimorphosa]